MAIDFELSEGSKLSQKHYRGVAVEQMRPISRKYDLAEHQLPTEWVDYWWQEGRAGPKDKSVFGSWQPYIMRQFTSLRLPQWRVIL